MVAYADLAAIADGLRAAIVANEDEALAPARPAADFLPTMARLRQQITAATVDPVDLLLDMLLVVAPRWIAVTGDGVDELDRINQHAAAMAGSPAVPPPGIAYRFGAFTYRLSLGESAPARGGAVTMRDLVEADGSRLDTLLGRLTDTPAHAAGAVLALRRFDDVLIRILAARRASALTGIPVARIITLHRVEGNLCVFPTDASLELGVPSAAGGDITGRGLGREPALAHPRPSFGHLVWLADETKAKANAGSASLIRFALTCMFMLHEIGADSISKGFTGSAVIDHFANWSAANHLDTGRATDTVVAQIEARLRFTNLEALLVQRTVSAHDNPLDTAVRIAPSDPVEFLAVILAEAAVYQEALGRAAQLIGVPSPPSALRLSDGLAAARYNWQRTPDAMAAMLYSALAAAKRSSVSTPLRTAIRADASLVALLNSTAKAVSAARGANATQNAQRDAITAPPPYPPIVSGRADSFDQLHLVPDVATFLLASDNLDRLGRFFDTVGTNTWASYVGLRRYGLATRRLLDFYSRVFP